MVVDLRNNNLDWLRLAFACQVMLLHAFAEFGSEVESGILRLASHFPGVPAFFFVSGFLIYASFSRKPNMAEYAKNRALRLFPGLVFTTLGGVLVVLLAHSVFGNGFLDKSIYLSWFAAQITLGQAWNPEGFRDVGNGVINGALWTITVEILFYIAVPIIFYLEKKIRYVVELFFLLSFALYAFGENIFGFNFIAGKTLFEFLELTPLVWGWMFLLGVLAWKNRAVLEKHSELPLLALLFLVTLIALDVEGSVFLAASGNRLGLLYFISLALLIVFFAFNTPVLSLRYDLSYGVYVWHMVIINLFHVLNISSVLATVLVVIGISIVSWLLVERPALRMKNVSIRGSFSTFQN